MKTILTHVLTILLACLVAMPMYAAKPKKVKQKTCKPISHIGNKYYCDDQTLRESEMLDFYADHNCQEAYTQFKRGRQCTQAGWTFLAVGIASTSISLGCGIAYAVDGLGSIINAYSSGSGRRYQPDKELADASLAFGVIATATTITCIPLLKVGKKKIKEAEETYNAVCAGKRKYTPKQAYLNLQASENGIGFALNF